MKRSTLFLILVCASGVSPAVAQGTLSATYLPRVEKILRENIVPFWRERSIDRTHGGYLLNHDLNGETRGEAVKMIVTQSRMVWYFSRMARAGFQPKENLDLAGHGFRFLRDRMWDGRNGGFYWQVDVTGSKKLLPSKHLYGQSFGLYALSEYYMASSNKEALDLANRLFHLLETKAHDRRNGGYREFFAEDWSDPPAGTNSYMGAPPDTKLMNTHLHLLEAFTSYYRASKLPLVRERLLELITIETNTVVRKDLGACTDRYRPDWTPILDGPFARVSYGHDIENVWLVADACDAAGVPVQPYADLFRTLWQYSLRYGYDSAAGGFFDSGAFREPASRRNKVWWVQAEALVSALYMYRLTGEGQFLDLFSKTLEFVESRQADWKNGDWFESVMPDGKPGGGKAHAWKSAYHNARAMVECIALLPNLK